MGRCLRHAFLGARGSNIRPFQPLSPFLLIPCTPQHFPHTMSRVMPFQNQRLRQQYAAGPGANLPLIGATIGAYQPGDRSTYIDEPFIGNPVQYSDGAIRQCAGKSFGHLLFMVWRTLTSSSLGDVIRKPELYKLECRLRGFCLHPSRRTGLCRPSPGKCFSTLPTVRCSRLTDIFL